jgi:hypothetical protein
VASAAQILTTRSGRWLLLFEAVQSRPQLADLLRRLLAVLLDLLDGLPQPPSRALSCLRTSLRSPTCSKATALGLGAGGPDDDPC